MEYGYGKYLKILIIKYYSNCDFLHKKYSVALHKKNIKDSLKLPGPVC
jgi:hypothetical protein